MARNFSLIACANFDREILAIQSSPDFRDVRFKTLPADCDQVEAEWHGLREAVGSFRDDGCSVCIFGSYCLTRAEKDFGLGEACRFVQKGQCFEWVADKESLDRFLQDGALLVLPGWLRDWEAQVDKRWPSGRKSAQTYFRELAKKVVLLDTGVHPDIDRELKSFARFLRLPHEVFPAGLEHFKLSLARIVLSWRVEREKEGIEDHVTAIRRQMSDYARIGPLLEAVTNVKSVEEALAGVLEFFRVLLSPQEVVYHPVESFSGRPGPEGSPWDRIIALNADYAWTDDRRAIYLKISHHRELLGILEVVGFGDPERREHDLDLALALARISGLALANVKTSRALNAERDRAAIAEAALTTGEEKMTTIFSYPLGLYRTTPQGQILDATPTLARMLGYPDVAALRTVNFWDIHNDPADRDSWQAVLDSSSMVEIFETQLRRSNGTLFWAKDSSRAAKDSRGDALFYDGVIEDISRKKHMEEDHSWGVRLQASVSDVSERLLSPTPIEEMSSVVLEHARRLTASATAFVGHIDERTGRLVPAALTPDARDLLAGHSASGGNPHEASGMWRWVLEKLKPIVTNDTSMDPRFSGMPTWHLPVRQFLAVPAVMSGGIVGLIVVANGENPYVERDRTAIERLATLYAIAIHRTRTENELRDLSLIDELTKVYNRRGFMTLGEQQIKVAHRTKKEMSIFYADLDDLKKINDTYGHDKGDAVLVEAAAMLRDAFRDSDIIARLGGDEFAVLAIDVAEGKATTLARRLREKIAARNSRPGQEYSVSFSLGTARYDPDKPCTLAELITSADRKMYQDKNVRKAD
ncbi:MAG: diguanylate cyclase [Acidobacteria bacterium]|nr:diguanylate cyclase [Acidobacteriota bacterium]